MRNSRSLLVFCGLAAVLGCLLVSEPAMASLEPGAYYISPDGSNAAGRDGSASEPWRTLRYAIKRIRGGDSYLTPAISDKTIYLMHGATTSVYEDGNMVGNGDPRVLTIYLQNTTNLRIVGLTSDNQDEAETAADGPIIDAYFEVTGADAWENLSAGDGMSEDVYRTTAGHAFGGPGWNYAGMIQGYIEHTTDGETRRYALVNYVNQPEDLDDSWECYPPWANLLTENQVYEVPLPDGNDCDCPAPISCVDDDDCPGSDPDTCVSGECIIQCVADADCTTSPFTECRNNLCQDAFGATGYNGVFTGPGLYHDRDAGANDPNPIDPGTNRLYVRLTKTPYMTSAKAATIGFGEDLSPTTSDYPDTESEFLAALGNGAPAAPKVHFRSNQAYFNGQGDRYGEPLCPAPTGLEMKGFTLDGMGITIHGTSTTAASDITLTGLRVRGSGIVLKYASDVLIQDVAIEGSHPWWVPWHDIKSGRAPADSLENQAVSLEYCSDVEIADCKFSRKFDGVHVFNGSHDVVIKDTEFDDIVDDCVQMHTTSFDVEIYRNKMIGSASSVSRHFYNGEPGYFEDSGSLGDYIGRKYIHHNIIDQTFPVQWGRPRNPSDPDTSREYENYMDAFGSHGNVYKDDGIPSADPRVLAHNTVMAGESGGSSSTGIDSGFLWHRPDSGLYDRPYQLILDNVFVQEDQDGVMVGGGMRGDGTMFADGNLYWYPQATCNETPPQGTCPNGWDPTWFSWDPNGDNCDTYIDASGDRCTVFGFGDPPWFRLYPNADTAVSPHNGACFTLANVIDYMDDHPDTVGWEANGEVNDPGIDDDHANDDYRVTNTTLLYAGAITTDEDFPMPCDMIRRVYRGAIVPDPEVDVTFDSIDTTATYPAAKWYDPMRNAVLAATVDSSGDSDAIVVDYEFVSNPVATIPIPDGTGSSQYNAIDSVEPFVAGGHSYLSMRVYTAKGAAQIWVVKVPDPDAPADCFATMRCDTLDGKGTGDGNTAARTVPHVNIAANGEILITYVAGNTDHMQCNTGIHMGVDQVFVDGSVSSGGDGSGGDPFNTIQDGITAVDDGGTVFVLDGTYDGAGNVNLDFGGKAITVRSLNGAALTTIDGQLTTDVKGFVFDTSEGADSIVDGFAITRMTAGGIYCSGASPTVRNCVISNCAATGDGGGINATNSSLRCEDCIFRNNSATVWGGAAHFATSGTPVFIGCEFDSNSAGYCGGAISSGIDASSTDVVAASCYFHDNSAKVGGALHGPGDKELSNCLVVDNTAYLGGAMTATGDVAIANCTIVGNTATVGGGGAIMISGSDITVANSIFWDNTADLAYAGHIVLYNGSDLTITQCCVQDGDGEILITSGCTSNLASAVIITGNPDFLDSANGDYRLDSTTSSCYDAGDDASVPADTYDIDGDGDTDDDAPDLESNERIQGASVDVGAYEVEE